MKALVTIFVGLLTVYSLYLLSFTWFVNSHEKEMEKQAVRFVKANFPSPEQKYPGNKELQALYQDSLNEIQKSRLRRLLDSTKDKSITWWGNTYQKAKENELLLGLDLQGGINVTLNVELSGLIKGLANNEPRFKNYYFNVNGDNYFYPASTVKMPVALMALQRLNELKVFGLNSNSTMIVESSFSGQTSVYNDPTAPDGRPSIEHYIKKIFLVSDNDAFNRLYEFLGQQYINEQFAKKGYRDAFVLHRLSIPLSYEENRHTNPIKFFSEEGEPLYTQPMQVNQQSYVHRYEPMGKGYFSNGTLIREPMDFSKKNRIGLENLSNILKSILFPSAVPVRQRFNLKPEEYRFVWKYMSQLPSETTFPCYDSARYWDAYAKFLLYGSEKANLPKHIRIFNKVGDAYGFLTDVAYVADFENNIEFMLSATIYCNSDGILNDDKYDYDTIGFPFMKNLGELIYSYELKRRRRHQPDLSGFKMDYDRTRK